MLDRIELAKMIDYTLLRADTTTNDIKRICLEAVKYGFYSVCINPHYVDLATKLLKQTNVKVCSVVGFPLGANSRKVKVFEAETAVSEGSDEIDMVINLGALKSLDFKFVKEEIREIVLRTKEIDNDVIVKVIIEAGLLTEGEKIRSCQLTKEAGADFVKTSTAFNGSGATVDDVKLIRSVVGPSFGVKASGGIRTYLDATNLINAGASRLGTSTAVKIIEQEQ